jgi:hypothetical protein
MKAVKGDELRVEVGRPMSTDGGVVMVFRHIRSSGWFKALVAQAIRDPSPLPITLARTWPVP